MRTWPRLAAVAALALSLLSFGRPVAATGDEHSVRASERRASGVSMTVANVAPSVPIATTADSSLAVTLNLTNTSGAALDDVTITAQRGDPIGNQTALNSALQQRSDPPTTGLTIQPTRPVSVNLPTDSGSVEVTFRTTTSTSTDGKGLCLCQDRIYPLYFYATAAGSSTTVASAITYLPSFGTQPVKSQVAWLWPLIDRPHRLVSSTTFIDDDLAASVSDDGRLDRALQVLERVEQRSPGLPITLVVDPELLDELQVMTAGNYRVRTSDGGSQRGTGQAVAASWLVRLRTVLSDHPEVRVVLTPYADPDVQSLSAQGLGWTSALPDTMVNRVTTALGTSLPEHDIAWPASTRVSKQTLTTLRASGSKLAVLGSAAVHSQNETTTSPVVRLGTQNGTVAAALTDQATRAYIQSAVTAGGSNAAALPALFAQLSVSSIENPDLSHPSVLTPPRYVNPAVSAAVRTIVTTSTTGVSTPASVRSLITGAAATAPATTLAAIPADSPGLPDTIIDQARSVQTSLPTVTSLLQPAASSSTLLTALPQAVQRIESSAWRVSATGSGDSLGTEHATSLARQVTGILSAVHIVKPTSSGSYTLASSNSPLPITVANDNDYPVVVDVDVNALGGLPGFDATRLTSKRIEAHGKQTLSVPARVQRSGRIRIVAQLFTTADTPIGRPVHLSVHSTVLGLIGVLITIVAGAVLLLALLVRFVRRVRRLRAKRRNGAERPNVVLAAENLSR